MLNPTRGVNWISRALVLGLTCLAITVVAHAAAGGATSPVGIGFVSVLMTLGAIFATSRELSFAGLFGFLAGSQVVCHLLLNGFGHSAEGGGASLATSSERGAHALHALSPGPDTAVTEAVAADHGMSLTMLLAHVIACAAAALVLREGERVMFSLHRALPNIVRVLFGLLVGKPSAALPPSIRPSQRLGHAIPALKSWMLTHDVSRRGPPVISFDAHLRLA